VSGLFCNVNTGWRDSLDVLAGVKSTLVDFHHHIAPLVLCTKISYTGLVSSNDFVVVDSETPDKGLHAFAFKQGYLTLIAFRGTTSAADVCADIVLDEGVVPPMCRKYSTDYVRQAWNFTMRVRDLLPENSILLTGHSLGCSLSNLVTAMSITKLGVPIPSICFAPGSTSKSFTRLNISSSGDCSLNLYIPGDPIFELNKVGKQKSCPIAGVKEPTSCKICSALPSRVDPACYDCFEKIHVFKNYIQAIEKIPVVPCAVTRKFNAHVKKRLKTFEAELK